MTKTWIFGSLMGSNIATFSCFYIQKYIIKFETNPKIWSTKEPYITSNDITDHIQSVKIFPHQRHQKYLYVDYIHHDRVFLRTRKTPPFPVYTLHSSITGKRVSLIKLYLEDKTKSALTTGPALIDWNISINGNTFTPDVSKILWSGCYARVRTEKARGIHSRIYIYIYTKKRAEPRKRKIRVAEP